MNCYLPYSRVEFLSDMIGNSFFFWEADPAARRPTQNHSLKSVRVGVQIEPLAYYRSSLLFGLILSAILESGVKNPDYGRIEFAVNLFQD